MKWKKKTPIIGDTRIIRRFAIFPIIVNNYNIREYKWLERAYIKQQYDPLMPIKHWENIKFVDKEDL
jgi:hypothetical protein